MEETARKRVYETAIIFRDLPKRNGDHCILSVIVDETLFNNEDDAYKFIIDAYIQRRIKPKINTNGKWQLSEHCADGFHSYYKAYELYKILEKIDPQATSVVKTDTGFPLSFVADYYGKVENIAHNLYMYFISPESLYKKEMILAEERVYRKKITKNFE